jgi:hypothetical protein
VVIDVDLDGDGDTNEEDNLVSVAFIGARGNSENQLRIRNYSTKPRTWEKKNIEESQYASYEYRNDTAWLYDEELDKYYIAAITNEDDGSVGFHKTGNLKNYGSFTVWKDHYNVDISGMWMNNLTGNKYVLSKSAANIKGISNDGSVTILFQRKSFTSMRRRVSMFNVPVKQ